MDETVLIASMATLVILSAFLSIISSRIKLPPLIGFLAAGIIIANFMDFTEDGEHVVEIFSDLGLIMLMFSIGMEINLRQLRSQGKFALIVAIVQLPLMVAGGLISGLILGFDMLQSICLGCIISGSSTAVVTAVLKSQGNLDKEHIDTLILVTIMEDIGQVIMLSMLTPMLHGSEMSSDALVILIIQIAVFMIACFTAGLIIVPRVIDYYYKRSNDELISLLCIGGLFVLCYAATKMGLSVAIGAFLMGIIVGSSRPKDAVNSFVEPLKSLFMSMFFISVGMEVTLNGLTENIALIVIIFLVFLVCKSSTVFLGYWIGDGEPRAGFLSAIGLCAMGEFAFIIAKEALDNGVVDEGFYTAVIGAALLSMIVMPLLNKVSGQTYDAMHKHCPKFLMRFFTKLTEKRDRLYSGLDRLAVGTKEALGKGFASIYFNIFLIVLIEVIFYFSYDFVCKWFVDNFGAEDIVCRTVMMTVNFLILLIPCIGFSRNLRLILYILNAVKMVDRDFGEFDKHMRFHDVLNPLIVGGALSIFIIILVPNNLATPIHVGIAVLIIFLLTIRHIYLIKKGKIPLLPLIPINEETKKEIEEEIAEEQEEEAAEEESTPINQ
ncbi:MAG: cation:proton antiporter [Candidatus Methanomethylophilaceae archaeon]|nr:cation:proton antiporter [Candidatus Methanomethylophilaceae archaeon]